jgi:hypothetical protein
MVRQMDRRTEGQNTIQFEIRNRWTDGQKDRRIEGQNSIQFEIRNRWTEGQRGRIQFDLKFETDRRAEGQMAK